VRPRGAGSMTAPAGARTPVAVWLVKNLLGK
jgi:hypothetical protein